MLNALGNNYWVDMGLPVLTHIHHDNCAKPTGNWQS